MTVEQRTEAHQRIDALMAARRAERLWENAWNRAILAHSAGAQQIFELETAAAERYARAGQGALARYRRLQARGGK